MKFRLSNLISLMLVFALAGESAASAFPEAVSGSRRPVLRMYFPEQALVSAARFQHRPLGRVLPLAALAALPALASRIDSQVSVPEYVDWLKGVIPAVSILGTLVGGAIWWRKARPNELTEALHQDPEADYKLSRMYFEQDGDDAPLRLIWQFRQPDTFPELIRTVRQRLDLHAFEREGTFVRNASRWPMLIRLTLTDPRRNLAGKTMEMLLLELGGELGIPLADHAHATEPKREESDYKSLVNLWEMMAGASRLAAVRPQETLEEWLARVRTAMENSQKTNKRRFFAALGPVSGLEEDTENSLPIGTIRGIEIRIHRMLVPVSVLLGFAGVRIYTNHFPQEFAAAVATGLLVPFLIYGSFLAHEMGHILAGRFNRMRGEAVHLAPLRAHADVGYQAGVTPANEIRVLVAGPLTNILLAGAFKILSGSTFLGPVLQDFLGALSTFNFMIGTLALLPALPLDGGKIAQLVSARKGAPEAHEALVSQELSGTVVGMLMVYGIVRAWLSDWTGFLALGVLALILTSRHRQAKALEKKRDAAGKVRLGLFERAA